MLSFSELLKKVTFSIFIVYKIKHVAYKQNKDNIYSPNYNFSEIVLISRYKRRAGWIFTCY